MWMVFFKRKDEEIPGFGQFEPSTIYKLVLDYLPIDLSETKGGTPTKFDGH